MPRNGSWDSGCTKKIAGGEMGKDHFWELEVPGTGIPGQAEPKRALHSQARCLWSGQVSSKPFGRGVPFLPSGHSS